MKPTIQIVRIGLAALLLAAPSTASVAARPQTGLQGQTMLYISYGAPVEIEPGVWIGVPGVHFPVATSFTVLSARSGHEVGRFTTDAQGAFEVSLNPGKYVIAPDPLTMAFGCTVPTGSFEVKVNPKQFTPATIFYFRDGPCSISGTAP